MSKLVLNEKYLNEKKALVEVSGKENVPKGTNFYIANHTCLMDIFLLRTAIKEQSISVISSRLMFKNDKERQAVINELLTPFPLEVHAGAYYTDLCMQYLTTLLSEGKSLNIFPEGAYVPEDGVWRARTGAARILFNARQNTDEDINFIPVAINIVDRENHMDEYIPWEELKANISFLEPIDYQSYLEGYLSASSKSGKSVFLHGLMDEAMQNIAKELRKEYRGEYIELWPRKEFYMPDGTSIAVSESDSPEIKTEYTKRLSLFSKRISR